LEIVVVMDQDSRWIIEQHEENRIHRVDVSDTLLLTGQEGWLVKGQNEVPD